jgi:hypothetical protein
MMGYNKLFFLCPAFLLLYIFLAPSVPLYLHLEVENSKLVLLGWKVVSFLTLYSFLRYLSQGNLRDANLLMDELKALLKSSDLEFPKTDLIQFIRYLLPT